MARLENLSLSPGQGRVSGSLSVALGALCLLGVLCFHFPQYLTTPELRQNYNVAILPFLDRIFGTYYEQHERWPENYGVVGKPLPQGFLAQHVYPFMEGRKAGG
jgi:sterol desaturase/sphingolipid hydroxylase (fatty acid hydroxylase superfamily)